MRQGIRSVDAPVQLVCGRRSFAVACLLCLLLGVSARSIAAPAPATSRAHGALSIYFIDVEGGQSTLIVTPRHHSLLIDTGWAAGGGPTFQPGEPHAARDANRIVAAARDAGVDHIDYLLLTHFHIDHAGGVSELAQLMPIRTFIDHSAPSADADRASPGTQAAYDAWRAVRSRGAHLQPEPGEHLPLDDVEAIVVSSAGATLEAPLGNGGATNPSCPAQASPPRDPYENPRSTGVVLRYGKFRFLDVGDLTGPPLFRLVCPRNMIGTVDAYLIAHHGGPDVAVAETFGALRPRIAILNNGLSKGGARQTLEELHRVSSLEDVWQLHASREAADANFQPAQIANPDESTAYWIELVASADGSFGVLNQRTHEWKIYPPRPR
jgi:competence protein ComEC